MSAVFAENFFAADFGNRETVGGSFVVCDFRQADFGASLWRRCLFRGCDFSGAQFATSTFERCTFQGCQFNYAFLDRAHFAGGFAFNCVFDGAVAWGGARIEFTSTENSSFYQARIRPSVDFNPACREMLGEFIRQFGYGEGDRHIQAFGAYVTHHKQACWPDLIEFGRKFLPSHSLETLVKWFQSHGPIARELEKFGWALTLEGDSRWV